MERKSFIQHSLLAGAGLFTAGTVTAGSTDAPGSGQPASAAPAPGQPFHLNYGIHDGMFRNNAGPDFIDQIKFAYDQGFRAIEDNGMARRPPEQQQQIGDALAKLGMAMGVFVLDKGGNGANSIASGKPECLEIFLKGCRQAVEVSKRCNGKLTTVVPGDFERHLPIGIQTARVIEALRRGAEILEPHGIVMVLEPLSDTPDLFLRDSDQAYAICKAVNSPVCKILFDMYHIQRNQGDLIHHIDLCYDEIAYFQIGNNPGRNEPGTGEMDYRGIFSHIHGKGYAGILGMEHGLSKPGKEGEWALIEAYRESDHFSK
ncbi:MAG: TIM barrel protein [Bacteroidota bacterium]|nr:TIM barrel protein [Bacteroidota bacterium]MDP4217714.1 TIM barrel protein [Bacteroidota bacterium]MDP4247540.1 TIM barrel protein [Bacteroidota bacterium]MDP4254148.1 TIM barrel protein [Bacteroidota bacterium]MDP4259640.1 TIM barrel protein [Bacteroidota bacterium]